MSGAWRTVWLDLVGGLDSVAVADAIGDPMITTRLAEVRALAGVLGRLDVVVELDLCVVRSHEYYTGVAFEIDVFGADGEVFVEVGGGGRYDRLVEYFLPDAVVRTVPSTGFAFGVERLVRLLDDLGLLGVDRRTTSVVGLASGSADLLVVAPSTPTGYLTAVDAARSEREQGRSVDVFLGAPQSHPRYATARGIPHTRVV